MARNPIDERQLTKQGVDWNYLEQIFLSDIDDRKSLKNQARLDTPIEKELVDQYARNEKEGDEFPAVIVYRPGKGRYLIIDGNHRVAAKLQAGKKVTDAYVVNNNDPMVIDRMTWTWNNHNGKRLTYEENMHHACSLVRKYNMGHKEAAKECGVNTQTLSQKLKAMEITDILNRNSVTITPTLNERKILYLAVMIPAGEDVLTKAAQTISENGLGDKEVQELVRAVKRARDHDGKIKAIDDYAKEEKVQAAKAITKGGKSKPKARPSTTMMYHFRALERLFEDYPQDVPLRPLPADFKDAQGCVGTVTIRAIKLFGLGAMPKENVG